MKAVSFSEIFEFVRNGKSIKQNDTSVGIPITRIETIWDSSIDESRFGYANITDVKPYKNSLLKVGDILMSHINSPKHLGKCALYEGEPATLIHGMNLLNMRPNRKLSDPKYLFFYLSSSVFKQQIKKISNQSVNQASFSAGNFKKLKLPLPPLVEQKRIAAILDAADQLRQKDQELIDHYTSLSQSLFLEMFGDPVSNSMAWGRIALGELGKITSGSTPSRDIAENYMGDIPWVKTAEVNGRVINETAEHISQIALDNSSCKLYPPGSLIIAMYGQGKTRGQVGILGIEAATNQACAVIPPTDMIDFRFLFSQLNFLYDDLRKLGRGGNQPNLNCGLVKAYPVIFPPKKMQTQYAQFDRQIEKQKKQAQINLEKSEILFNSLLQRAFKGELTNCQAA